jgi:hypothetical protein
MPNLSPALIRRLFGPNQLPTRPGTTS